MTPKAADAAITQNTANTATNTANTVTNTANTGKNTAKKHRKSHKIVKKNQVKTRYFLHFINGYQSKIILYQWGYRKENLIL